VTLPDQASPLEILPRNGANLSVPPETGGPSPRQATHAVGAVAGLLSPEAGAGLAIVRAPVPVPWRVPIEHAPID